MISKLQLMKTLLLGTIIGTKQDVAKPILADTATLVAVSAKMGLGLSWFLPIMVPKCHGTIMVPKCHGLIPRSFHTIEHACLDGYRSPRLSNVKNGKHYNKWFSWYFTTVDPYHGGMKNIKTTVVFSKKKVQTYCFSLQCFSCGFNNTYFISNVQCKTQFRFSSTFSSLSF